MDFETPEADAIEQVQQGREDSEEEGLVADMTETPPDANPADVAEQRYVVPDDDPYDPG
ncbi:hypothetical protein FHX42_001757 [Saccharopolyspora lacisalsi]|uniref:Uncharacterized protein n=1 Tax=Halosaccharopolyspora lacisalsi TaxID=1000566 RepID=A0A839DU11_9PSEU|nr:hypothetical protein [Halosaccharopolyspora lacisalsi]MBA8824410.1 hypothetical protein [Halosaccharopolyspora lacisalsi]